MKTAGNLIRETRLKLNLSRSELGNLTRIKTNFIKAIEESDWNSLPELPVVIGFVKSISHFLDIDDNLAVALLKREYKPSKDFVKIKEPKFKRKLIWGPRLTFLAGILIVIFVVIGYLGLQYKKFNSPPSLVLNTPQEGQVINNDKIKVSGSTDPDATVEINNQPVIVEENGNFEEDINVSAQTTQIKVVARSRSGKTTSISRTIKVE